MTLRFVKASAVLVILLAGCSGGSSTNDYPAATTTPVPATVLTTQPSAYSITVFAQTKGTLQPDDLVQVGNSVYVILQDSNINPDGTLASGVTSAQSKLAVYDLSGNLQQTYDLPGHPDGMVALNSGTIWISSNEDANPLITVFTIASGALQTYSSDVDTLAHGGGLDDLKVINGVVYASASNPTTTMSPSPNLAPYSSDVSGATAEYGVNTGPVLYSIALNSNGATYHATPALMSSITVNSLPGNTPITLNMTDADSSALDPIGNFVITSQQDSEIVTVSNLGTPSQSVSVVNMTLYGNPWPLDDTRWVPAGGATSMLVSDPPTQLIYQITAIAGFQANSAFSSGQGTVLQSNTGTGVLTPIFTGMNNPHGLIFLSN